MNLNLKQQILKMNRRVIKFRCWNGAEMLNNVGFHPFEIQDLKDTNQYQKDEEGRYVICPDFVSYKLMQYVGLTDKHNNEIYEGDIVKRVYYPMGARPSVYEYSHIGVVEYQYNSFGVVNKLRIGTQLKPEECLSYERESREIYKHPSQGKDWFDSGIRFFDYVVIGNIYQNPELIEL